jgi:hypothetical protein
MQFHVFLISIFCATLRIAEPRSEKSLIPKVSSTREQVSELLALLEEAIDPIVETIFALVLWFVLRSTTVDPANSLGVFL